MRRRDLLATVALLPPLALARSALAQGSARVLRFVPEGNLNNPDPVWTTTTVARNHGLMIWDMLYDRDEAYTPRPQMPDPLPRPPPRPRPPSRHHRAPPISRASAETIR